MCLVGLCGWWLGLEGLGRLGVCGSRVVCLVVLGVLGLGWECLELLGGCEVLHVSLVWVEGWECGCVVRIDR